MFSEQSSGEYGPPDLPLLLPTVPAVAAGLVAQLLDAAAALLAAALLGAAATRARSKFEPLGVLVPALVREALTSLPPLHNPDRLVRQHLVATAEQVHLVVGFLSQSWSLPGLLKQIEFRYFLISKIIK